MSKTHENRKKLADAAPEQAAALLVKHATTMLTEASSILWMAGARREGNEQPGFESLFALSKIATQIAADAIRFEDVLQGLREPVERNYVIRRVVELACNNPAEYLGYPSFIPSMMALAEFLTEELGDGWPLAVLCPDDGGTREGDVDGWAFAVLHFDTTSYVTDRYSEEDGPRVDWMGTSWEPGCECADDDDAPLDEHADDCPAVLR